MPVSRVAVGAFRCVTTPIGYVLVSDVTIACSVSNGEYVALACICAVFLMLSAIAGPAWLHRHISGIAASDKLHASAPWLLLHDIVSPYRPGWESFEIWRALYRLSMVLLAAVPTAITPSLGLVQSVCGALVSGAYATVLWRGTPFERTSIAIRGRTFQNVTNRMECASASLACVCCISSIIVYATPGAGGALSALLIVGTVIVAAPMLFITIHDLRLCPRRRRGGGRGGSSGGGDDTVSSLFLAGDVAGARRLAAKHAEARRLRKRAVDDELGTFLSILRNESGTTLRAEGAGGGGRTDEQLIADMSALRAEQVTLTLSFAPPEPQQALDAVVSTLQPVFDKARARFITATIGVTVTIATTVATESESDTTNGSGDAEVQSALSGLLAAGAAIDAAVAPQRDDLLNRDWVDAAAHVHAVIVAAACADAPGARSATAVTDARVAESCTKLQDAVAARRWDEAAKRAVATSTAMSELRAALTPAVARANGSRQFHTAAATALAVAAAAARVESIADTAPEEPPLQLDAAFVTRARELGEQYHAAMLAMDEPARRRAKEQRDALCDAHAALLEATAAAHGAARRYRAAAQAEDAVKHVKRLRENRGAALAGEGTYVQCTLADHQFVCHLRTCRVRYSTQLFIHPTQPKCSDCSICARVVSICTHVCLPSACSLRTSLCRYLYLSIFS